MRLSHHALPVLIHWTRQMLWRLLAAVSVLLGIIGAFLPVLPTVPFLLLGAWAAGRGWPALEARLLAHPNTGRTSRTGASTAPCRAAPSGWPAR